MGCALDAACATANARIDLLFTMSDNAMRTPPVRRDTRANDIRGNEHSAACAGRPAGGARRDRTDDLLLAKQALSQLSYGPDARRGEWGVANRAGRERSFANRYLLFAVRGGPGKI